MSGEAQQTFKGDSDYVNAVAISPNGGSLVASASRGGTVKLWDTRSEELRRTLHGHLDWVNTVAFSPDGSLVASASWDRTVKLWRTWSGEARWTFVGHSEYVNTIAFSQDGCLIASAWNDGTIKLCDTGSGKWLQTLKGHSDCINAVTFSPDASLVASASWDKTVRLWDTRSGEERQAFTVGSIARKLSFFSDGVCIHTDVGILEALSGTTSMVSRPLPLSPGLSVKGEWVTYGSEALLWLPSDYRATCFVVFGSTVVLGHASGRISVLEFTHLPSQVHPSETSLGEAEAEKVDGKSSEPTFRCHSMCR